MAKKLLLIVVACSVLWVRSASAQTCLGELSFTETAPLHVGAEAAFSEDSHSFGGGVSYGKRDYFGRGAIGVTSLRDAETTEKSILARGGQEYRLNRGRTPCSICPVLALAKNWGPSVQNGSDPSSWLFGIGGSVGFVATKTARTTVVPTLGLSFNRISQTSTANVGGLNGQSTTNSSNFGDAQFRVGLIFNDKMALVPSVVVPFHIDGGQTAFSILFSAKIGE